VQRGKPGGRLLGIRSFFVFMPGVAFAAAFVIETRQRVMKALFGLVASLFSHLFPVSLFCLVRSVV
jgi:hypothetical protein